MLAAVLVGVSIQADAGKGHGAGQPLTCDEDPEALLEGGAGDSCDHLSQLAVPGGGIASAEHAGELLDPLLAKCDRQQAR